jgi:integrase
VEKMKAPTASDNPAEAEPTTLAEPTKPRTRKQHPSRNFDDTDITKAIEQQVRRTQVWDTPGLYLMVDPPGPKHHRGLQRWMFRFTRPGTGRVTEIGIGHWPLVKLDQARAAVLDHRHWLRKGIDPQRVTQEAQQQTITFAEAGDKFIETRKRKGWTPSSLRAAKYHIHQHGKSLLREAVAAVTRVQVADALTPLYDKHRKQALRVLATWRQVFDNARFEGWRNFENPALWKGMHENRFGFKAAKRHHPWMPFEAVPEFMKALRQQQEVAARALEFLILTATRTSETLRAQWSEFGDLQNQTWAIPAERMKGRKEHRVPLSSRLLELLNQQRNSVNGSPYVFPRDGRNDNPLPEASLRVLLREMDIKFTVHGFRASFRNWAARTHRQDRDLGEMSLAHKVKREVEAAYWHEDMLAERRPIMQAWADYCGETIFLASSISLVMGDQL